ncbi:MAG TPA: hypothetical protein PLD88_12005, partial [Candidatus Berkiella sp.]|nr:hypothetical protein [Candidatus Berkiella sp.]
MSAVGPITIDQAKKLLRAVELYVNDSKNMSTVGDYNHLVVKQELEEGKSAMIAVKLLEDIRENDIS